MPLIIGLFLIPVVLLIIKKSNMVTTTRKNKFLLNFFLFIISIAFIILCFVINMEPLKFEIHYSIEYMICRGEYIFYSGLIFLFSPFMWIVAIHYISLIYKKLKIRKKAILKGDEEYICYRGDLDKISPSLIMFSSIFDLDLKKTISSIILKLKLNGFIEEKEYGLKLTNKDDSTLLESEKMVLNIIKNGNFDKKLFQKKVEEECLKNKYIVKNRGGIFGSIFRIFLGCLIPTIVFAFSLYFDEYTLEYYHVYPEKNGDTYFYLRNFKDVEKLEKEVKDLNDYYSSPLIINGKETTSYNYSQIRANKIQYSIVRKALFLNALSACMIIVVIIFIFIGLYIIIEQIKYIKKGYRVTLKGKEMLNKAYALKNYLNNYSLIKERTEEELVLWEYYLIYAIILDVNVDIEDEIIEKYVKSIL